MGWGWWGEGGGDVVKVVVVVAEIDVSARRAQLWLPRKGSNNLHR